MVQHQAEEEEDEEGHAERRERTQYLQQFGRHYRLYFEDGTPIPYGRAPHSCKLGKSCTYKNKRGGCDKLHEGEQGWVPTEFIRCVQQVLSCRCRNDMVWVGATNPSPSSHPPARPPNPHRPTHAGARSAGAATSTLIRRAAAATIMTWRRAPTPSSPGCPPRRCGPRVWSGSCAGAVAAARAAGAVMMSGTTGGPGDTMVIGEEGVQQQQ